MAQLRGAEHPARTSGPRSVGQFLLEHGGEGGGDSPLLLRSQTSTVQIRVMESTPPPVRIISLGRVYRPDTADATHYPMFHQMEGLLIDRHVTMADLKSVLRLFAASYLGATSISVSALRSSRSPNRVSKSTTTGTTSGSSSAARAWWIRTCCGR
jgi:phenylalanyl-tRNA synthetase alpha subunit